MGMANSPKFTVNIYWSEEDKSFVAEVPALPGCFADGKSYTEVGTNVEVIIREWLETASELGRDLPKGY
jgi:predicted RNase H-like HicB family nuclease